ncbi:dynein light chain Tctex-type protein 2B-like [Daktulosphaira vitifoliae]|uniref:dynein light chain Tctex-type protein 2B-like n=1 Tax=Daktulosphaira vitifoliae TaxID=58002 RepID=UPI0021AA16BA|nr:dynein light chain Tctex-type protein 2B-like [Daktulosphaira vitifoliae]
MSTESEAFSRCESNSGEKTPKENFQIRPTQNEKFKTILAKEIIQETLHKYLKDKDYSQISAETLSKTIASEIKDQLKEKCINSRFKLMVQVVLGERHGAGIKIGARCIWDADTDTLASDQFLNETIFCMAVVFAVYFY